MNIISGAGGLPKVLLAAPDGATAEVYLDGAQLTSWIPAGGGERMFLSRAAEFRPGAAIRGGVPVVFPQFSELGPLPKHGFARISRWKFGGAQSGPNGGLQASFELGETPASHALWPHPFRAWLEVSLGGQELDLVLRIENTGETPFQFTAALHTYMQVADISRVALGGLGGAAYLAGSERRIQEEPLLHFAGEVDRVYLGPLGDITLQEDGKELLSIRASGFSDVVTWNPGPLKGAALADLEAEGWRRMVCVEAAAAAAPVELEPGQTWQGGQNILVKSSSPQ